MAQELSESAIVPSAPSGPGEIVQGDMGRYSIQVTDYSASGKAENFAVTIPADAKWGHVMLRAAILKRTTWKQFDIPTILHGVIYSDNLGLDIMAGDVYMAEEGRYSTTTGAKIKHAMSSGKVVGITVDTIEGPEIEIPWETRANKGVFKGPDLTTKVTIHVKDWTQPYVYTARLKEWFVGRNPNWRTRTRYMLEENAKGKACNTIAPMGVDPDEAPPATPQQYDIGQISENSLSKLLSDSIQNAKGGK